MNLLALERNRALEMMTGDRFVKRGRLVLDAALLFRLIRADEEDTRTAAVLGRWIVFVRRVLLAERRVGCDLDVGFRQQAEPLRRGRLGARERRLRVGDLLRAILELVLRI